MSRYLIIDADSLTYAIPAGCQDYTTGEPTTTEKQMCARLDNAIKKQIRETDASEYQLHLTGNDHIRRSICPLYKKNRKSLSKPVYYSAARDHLIERYGAVVSEGTEADDDVCIEYNKARYRCGYTPYEPILSHIDKDIDQLPGLHYNPRKKITYEITPEEGRYNLYTQSLVGDTIDNIKGIRGMGPKRTESWLAGYNNDEEQLYLRCLEKYEETYDIEEAVERLHRNMELLYLHRGEGDKWRVPKSE